MAGRGERHQLTVAAPERGRYGLFRSHRSSQSRSVGSHCFVGTSAGSLSAMLGQGSIRSRRVPPAAALLHLRGDRRIWTGFNPVPASAWRRQPRGLSAIVRAVGQRHAGGYPLQQAFAEIAGIRRWLATGDRSRTVVQEDLGGSKPPQFPDLAAVAGAPPICLPSALPSGLDIDRDP